MKKIIFRSELIYWISLVFFCISMLLLVIGIATHLGGDFHIITFTYLLILAILSVIITIKLFKKERSVFVYINVFLPLLIILILSNSFKVYSTHYIYEPEDIIFGILLIIYLVIINKTKISKKDIVKIDDIEEIGKI